MARMARQLEAALAGVGLSLPQYRLLGYLADGSAAASALATKLAVSPPSVTGLVDGVIARGYVERGHDTGDRRRVTHGLTPEGERALAEADAAVHARLVDIAGHLADPDRSEQALTGLELWQEALNARLMASVSRP
jgi:DNA-binding MarR family transcriptional regulator